MKKALTNAHILTGTSWRENGALLVEDGVIAGVCANNAVPEGYEEEDLGGARLLPGFIDVQVNGGGGILLNDAKSVADLETIASAHRRFGTTSLMPTLITVRWDRMVEVAALVREAIAAGVPGIEGVHFEGPYLNEERKGVHDANFIRNLESEFVDLATAGDLGNVVVTLAPERVSLDIIRQLTEAGVRVSAGHSNASYEQTSAALKAGLTGFTHLYNAMPPMSNRAPGIIGAALTDRNSFCGFINDGHHVHPITLRAAIAAKGVDHMMLVTDAMATVGTDMTGFFLGRQKIQVTNGRCETEDGTLAGSCLDMAAAVRNAVSFLELSLEEAVQMATSVPAAFLGLDKSHGRIEAGYRADLVAVDEELQVKKSWIAGK